MRFEVHNLTNAPIRVPVVLRSTLDHCIVHPGRNLIEADLIPNADTIYGISVSAAKPVAPQPQPPAPITASEVEGAGGEALLRASGSTRPGRGGAFVAMTATTENK